MCRSQGPKVGRVRLLQGPFLAAQDKPILLEKCDGEQAFNLVMGLLHDRNGARATEWCEDEVRRLQRCIKALSAAVG